jgi:hypothetical protein
MAALGRDQKTGFLLKKAGSAFAAAIKERKYLLGMQ